MKILGLNRMKLIVTFVIMIVGTQLLSAQKGITIIEDANIRNLMQDYISLNRSEIYMDGWRVQIITTDDRRKMESALYKFEQLYPYMQTNWEHRSPYYLVKAGAFRTKLELQAFLLEIKSEFPTAIPIPGKIVKEELLRM